LSLPASHGSVTELATKASAQAPSGSPGTRPSDD